MAGTAVRFELWHADHFIMGLGIGWDPEGWGDDTLYLPLIPGGDEYRIRIQSLWAPALFDESDEPFTIHGKGVRVIEPNGAEQWTAGEEAAIHWKTNTMFAGTAVSLDLWRGAERVQELAVGWDPLGEALTTIIVPDLPTGANYTIRATSLWDVSDAVFAIVNPSDPQTAVHPKLWTLPVRPVKERAPHRPFHLKSPPPPQPPIEECIGERFVPEWPPLIHWPR